VPIWYQYAPGGEVWVLTTAGSRIAGLIEAAGRFTLTVDRLEPTVRYGTDELLRQITERYLPAEKVDVYLKLAKTEFGEQVAIYLRPQRWLTGDMGPS
jgi:hypothetical protein